MFQTAGVRGELREFNLIRFSVLGLFAGEPNPSLTYSNTNPKCVYIHDDWNAQWVADTCSNMRAAICKKPAYYDPALATTLPSVPLGISTSAV